MAGIPTTAEESVEAVIISGERKGELIRISEGELTPADPRTFPQSGARRSGKG